MEEKKVSLKELWLALEETYAITKYITRICALPGQFVIFAKFASPIAMKPSSWLLYS